MCDILIPEKIYKGVHFSSTENYYCFYVIQGLLFGSETYLLQFENVFALLRI